MRSGVGTGHGSVHCWASFFSEAETVMALTMERAQGHWKDLNESLSNLCKQRTEGHWKAEVVGGRGFLAREGPPSKRMMNCIFHGDNGIRDLVGCHIQLSPFSQPRKHICHQTKGTRCSASIITLCPSSNTHPPRLEQLYRPCLPQHQ